MTVPAFDFACPGCRGKGRNHHPECGKHDRVYCGLCGSSWTTGEAECPWCGAHGSWDDGQRLLILRELAASEPIAQGVNGVTIEVDHKTWADLRRLAGKAHSD